MKYRTGFFTAGIVACTFMTVSAQLTVGGVLDFNIAGISVVPQISSEDYTSYLGLGIGGIVNYPLTGNLEIQAEPMLLQKGAGVAEGGEKLKLKILYLELPLFVRYPFPMTAAGIVPYVIAGVNLGLRASARVKFPGGGSDNAGDEFNAFDLGAGLGAGAEISKGNMTLFGEAKYVHGLSNINSEVKFDPDESRVMNKGLQVLVGIKVPIAMN